MEFFHKEKPYPACSLHPAPSAIFRLARGSRRGGHDSRDLSFFEPRLARPTPLFFLQTTPQNASTATLPRSWPRLRHSHSAELDPHARALAIRVRRRRLDAVPVAESDPIADPKLSAELSSASSFTPAPQTSNVSSFSYRPLQIRLVSFT